MQYKLTDAQLQEISQYLAEVARHQFYIGVLQRQLKAYVLEQTGIDIENGNYHLDMEKRTLDSDPSARKQ